MRLGPSLTRTLRSGRSYLIPVFSVAYTLLGPLKNPTPLFSITSVLFGLKIGGGCPRPRQATSWEWIRGSLRHRAHLSTLCSLCRCLPRPVGVANPSLFFRQRIQNNLGSRATSLAIFSSTGNFSRSGSGTFTFEPVSMLINSSAFTTPLP